jgi:phenylpyruvate tautomerase PptA (4-oxalocrotonate tautomerase family)
MCYSQTGHWRHYDKAQKKKKKKKKKKKQVARRVTEATMQTYTHNV